MDWNWLNGLTGAAIAAGLFFGGLIVKTWIIPWYVKRVDNKNVYWACFNAAKKADEYSDSKIGKSATDLAQNTLAMTACAAFCGAVEGSGLDVRAVFNEAMRLRADAKKIPIAQVKANLKK